MDDELRRFAEDPAAWGEIEPGSGYDRILTDRYCLLFGSGTGAQVSRLRLADDDVAETLHEVRAIVAARANDNVTWSVSNFATPDDLVDRLVAHGLVANDHQTSLVLASEPPAVPDVVVRRATTEDDLAVAAAITAAAFGRPAGPAPRDMRVYLAFLGRRAVATARMLLEPGTPGGLLVGGGVAPDARGRGAYRALVRARWDDAVAAGFAGVCVQARATSRPILERLGFDRVAEHHVLLDPATC